MVGRGPRARASAKSSAASRAKELVQRNLEKRLMPKPAPKPPSKPVSKSTPPKPKMVVAKLTKATPRRAPKKKPTINEVKKVGENRFSYKFTLSNGKTVLSGTIVIQKGAVYYAFPNGNVVRLTEGTVPKEKAAVRLFPPKSIRPSPGLVREIERRRQQLKK